ncbi:MAG: HesA/MoeB/ThiF family protein, partial [Candidatus Caldatribacteriota bacterium]|nr:HesA/MoeB/ThiF family protein [Candidatus Caldatribacteriota bacterium]
MKINSKVIIDELNGIKKKITADKEQEYLLLTIKKIKQIAKKYHYPSKEIEIIALNEGMLPTRYQKNYSSISLSEQIKLLRSKVAVIGCGGLGGNILELLARLGVGEIIVTDGDKFDESNLNRQILCTEENLKKSKAKEAAVRVRKINSSVKVKTHTLFINSKNIQEIIQGADLAIDALDNISTRFVLEKACQELEIPLIHGAVDGFNGQVSTIFPQDQGLELIYGSSKKLNRQKRISRLSVPAVTPALIASFQVQEVIKILLQKGKPLRNKLLFINLEDYDIEILKL